jgi:hypothetical protein
MSYKRYDVIYKEPAKPVGIEDAMRTARKKLMHLREWPRCQCGMPLSIHGMPSWPDWNFFLDCEPCSNRDEAQEDLLG